MLCALFVCVFVCLSVCLFVQAVVLEGKYWKRKVDAVASEYRKWRLFYRDKNVSFKCVELEVGGGGGV